MKRYSLLLLCFLSLLSCTKDIEQYNTEKRRIAVAPSATLFANGVRNFSDLMVSTNVNNNIFRLVVQYWATTTYQDEPNYNFIARSIPQIWWRTLYRDVLIDLQEAKRTIPTDLAVTNADVRNNQLAMADIMQVYAYAVLVNTFGNVPYSEALDYNNLFPKYDDAKTIYEDLLKRLDADIAALKPGAAGFPAAADVLYNGSTASWIKFANTLKIKLAMTLADVEPAKAKAAVEQANAHAFTSAADNAIFKYQKTTPNTNPLWVDLVQSGRADFIIANTLVNRMQVLHDPRVPLFFKPNVSGQYVGGVVGANNTFNNFAQPNEKLQEPDYPASILDYTELEFYRAEAVERGFAIPGSAEQHYNNAVRSSIQYWGGTTAQADAYLSQPQVAYATASSNYKEKIGLQKWIALFNKPFDAWTEYRRLDAPALVPPPTATSGFPNRFPYPINEHNLNKENYTKAVAANGQDVVETKLFWDKY